MELFIFHPPSSKYVKNWAFFNAIETVLSGVFLGVWLLDPRFLLLEERSWLALMQEDLTAFNLVS